MEARPIEGRRILIVDEDPNVAHLLTPFLERVGAQVVLATSVAEALRKVDREGKPDLIMAEKKMRTQGGFALIAELKKRHLMRVTPFFLFGTSFTKGERARAHAQGAILMEKPFSLSFVVKQVANQLAETEIALAAVADAG